MLMHLVSELVTQAGDAPPAATGGGGGLGGVMGMLPLLLMFVVIYFLLIRPASKQRREQQDMLGALKKDDEVVTAGGLYGKIVAIEERIITLEIADKVKVRILRDRISGKWLAAVNPPTKK